MEIGFPKQYLVERFGVYPHMSIQRSPSDLSD